MRQQYGFKLFNTGEFEEWLDSQKIGRDVSYVQEHHTFLPSYKQFKGDNHFELQKNMKHHHVVNNGWSDIGQHLTIFPDGTVMTGRSFERSPACIKGRNAHSVCIESVGDFDEGKDQMTDEQREAILKVTAALCKRFNVEVNTDRIVYHHWYNLDTGERNNGTGSNKSCPGTAFFGGNKVENANAHFIPLVQAQLGQGVSPPVVIGYGMVTASKLNIRAGAGTSHSRVTDREALSFGAIVRVFDRDNGWLKIAGKKAHWVSGKYVKTVRQATVTANTLNVRTGPGTSHEIADRFAKGEVVYLEKDQGDWSKVANEDKWLHTGYVVFSH